MSEQSPEQPGISPGAALDAAVDTAVVAALVGGVDTGLDKPADSAALPPNCLNCGAVVQGRYCLDCGQSTSTHVPTLAEVLGDAIVSLFNLDSRLWRTLGTLFFRPGLLTQDFLAGRRARYVPPLRLYLVMSVFLFLVLALEGRRDNDADELRDIAEQIDSAAGTAAISTDEAQAIEDAVIADVTAELAAMPVIQDDPDPDFKPGPGVNFTLDDDGELTVSDEKGKEIEIDNGCDGMDIPFADRGDTIDTAIRQACLDGVEDDFDSIQDAFVDNIPLMMFLVIPVMAAVLKVFYLFTWRPYLAHLILLCHTHAFTFLLLMVLILFRIVSRFVPWLETPFEILGWSLLLLYTPAYYFMVLRRVYGQGVLLTLVKLPLLMVIYLFAVTFVFMFGFLTVMLAS